MASPVTVGATAIVAVAANLKRVKVRFQNPGTTSLYFVRQIGTVANVPSATNYEFVLGPVAAAELNEAYIETNSTAQFNVVSSGAGGTLAIFETVRI